MLELKLIIDYIQLNQAEAVGLEVGVCRDEHQQASPQVIVKIYFFVSVVVHSYFCLRSIKDADVLSEQVMIIILPYYQRINNLEEAVIISLIFNSVIDEFCAFLDISR